MLAIDPAETRAFSEVVDWGRLAPYISVQFFQFGGPGEGWTAETLSFARELTEKLPSLVQQYPPESRRSSAAPRVARPQDIQRIGANFFDVSSGSLTSAVDLDKADSSVLTDQYIFLTAVWYRVLNPPTWLQRSPAGNSVEDVKHHLVLLAVLPPLVVLTATQEPMHTMMSAFLEEGQVESISLSSPAKAVPLRLLESAFVNGEAYHLWLSGLHRSVVTKPDRKTLAGRDLRHALDPYSEQSYTYTAVLSELGLPAPAGRARRGRSRSPSVGFSRSKRTVWTSRSPGIMEFAGSIKMFRELLQKADPDRESRASAEERRRARMGLNYLSIPIVTAELEKAKVPFEVHLDVGEPASGGTPQDDLGQFREEWRDRGFVELGTRIEDPSLLPVKAWFDSKLIASFGLRIWPDGEENVHVVVEDMEEEVHDEESRRNHELFSSLLDSGATFTIRYESGHVLEGQRLYKPEYQDVLFRAWKPIPLQDAAGNRRFDPAKEKPKSWDKGCRSRKVLREVGTGDSLFARVVYKTEELLQVEKGTEWYLLCHDQANEAADFVYIEPEGRRIALIHVKGAHSEKTARRVSIDAYQVVLAQAVKNLRNLEMEVLYRKLTGKSPDSSDAPGTAGVFQVSSADPGKVSLDTTGFMAALKRMTKKLPAIHKKVVVLQPHIRASYWNTLLDRYERSRSPRSDSKLWPAFMLSSLLIEAEVACRKLGVDFEVWCDAS